MKRMAFYMELQPGHLEDYTKAHNPIPKDVEKVLKDHGVRNYSIFHHPGTNVMFGYMEVEDESRLAGIADYECSRKWWLKMTNFLVCAHPGDEQAKEEPMNEVFHLD